MANFDVLFPVILRMEGGYTNDKSDKGGATNKGVTLATFTAWRKSQGKRTPTIAQLKALTDKEAKAIYKTLFWDKWMADGIRSQAVANIVVDWYINSGTKAVKRVQTMLGTKSDGIVGKITLALLNAQGDSIFDRIFDARVAFYHAIVDTDPTQQKFLNGWMNRLRTIKDITRHGN